MATKFSYRNKIHLEYRRNDKVTRENLKLIPNKENWQIAEELRKQAELLYESPNSNSVFKNLLKREIENREVSLLEAIEKYQEYLSLRSPGHQKNFVYSMHRLIEFLNPNMAVNKISSSDIIKYLNVLKNTVSNGTQRTYYTYIRLFFNFLIKEDILEKSPCRNVKGPTEEEKEIVILNDDENNRIFEYAKIKDYRFYIILKFLILTGMRPNDALRLKVQDFDFENNKIYLRISKTKNTLKFPIYKDLEEFIDDELSDNFENEQDSLIFEGYTVNNLGQKFRRLKRQLNLPNNYTLNLKSYRKTFATEMLNRGVRLEYVGYMLGHKKLQTTKKYYARINPDSIRAEIEKEFRNDIKT
ncbi:MAG: tyrosine-type recombinase/integrase [Ignavibacteria bacterium]